MKSNKIRILIAEDSPVVRAFLSEIISAELDLEVVAMVSNGKEAVEANRKYSPDLITMDIHMPLMNGFEATRTIMATKPVPIVVISSLISDPNLSVTFQAIEEGAVSVIAKPDGNKIGSYESFGAQFLELIRAMSEIKVVRRSPKYIQVPEGKPYQEQLSQAQKTKLELVAIGVSTGGPQALGEILSKIPADYPLPIIIVQHMSPGFIGPMAQWLDDKVPLNVCLAENDMLLRPGTVFFAPDNCHTKVKRKGQVLISYLEALDSVNGHRPSIDPLFFSVAQSCGEHAVGVLLTGMGSDGASGLQEMKNKNAHTLAQDEATSVVFGMPGSAIALGGVDIVMALEQIGHHLIKVAGR